ncbi:MAG TPA: DCC1-like thiol-disulfide oxidoreductase family protein [Verrucomicrobiae bacterium]|nr:DCC1-like thiol-disulfide oxidoreductase family protein [Verrucomicrobiae bacterium]
MRFKSNLRVAKPPSKPLMVYDGDCNFCKYWAARWKRNCDGVVDFTPFQDRQLEIRFPEIPQGQFQKAVHFIDADGAVYLGAEAVYRALARNRERQWPLNFYRHSRFFAKSSELIYHFVSRHRGFFSWIWGTHE